MCLQCVCDAVYVQPDGYILPGYLLMISRKDDPSWPIGSYGLVECNSPTFIIRARPMLDAYKGMTDNVLDEADTTEYKAWSSAFEEQITVLEEDLMCDPLDGYKLISAAKQAGWEPEKHG